MMNHANSAIDTESLPIRAGSGGAPPARRSGSGLEVQYFRDGALLKIGKCGEINPRLVCLLQPASSLAESYLRLCHTLEQLRDGKRGIVVGVTSPEAGDGKTFTAINLAGALAQGARARVLLVDLNLRQSGANVHSYFDLPSDANSGVSNWIGGATAEKGPVGYHLPDLNLHLMPAGTSVESPYKTLTSPRLSELFDQARREYDFVIVDTPSVLLQPDIELIAPVVDGFLVVVNADATPRHKLEEALNLMTQEKVLGLIFNGVRAS